MTWGFKGIFKRVLEFPAAAAAAALAPLQRMRIRYNEIDNQAEVSLSGAPYVPMAVGLGQDVIAFGTGLAIAAGATAQPGGTSFIREPNSIPQLLVWTSTVPSGLSNFWVPSQASPFDLTEVATIFAYFARGAGQPGNQYAGLIENRWSTNYVAMDIPIVVDWMIVAWRMPS